jgi:hypothetical protein
LVSGGKDGYVKLWDNSLNKLQVFLAVATAVVSPSGVMRVV